MTHGRVFNTEAVYEIRVMDNLDPSWSDWFDGLRISYQNDETLFVGVIPDQAALLGILTKIGQLNLTLVSVKRLENQVDNWNRHLSAQ